MDHTLRKAVLKWDDGSITFTNFEDTTADTEFWITGLDGWWGGVGVNGDHPQRALSHGQFATDLVRTGRALTLKAQMLFTHERDRDTAMRYVSGILGNGRGGTLTYNEDGLALTSHVRLDGEVKALSTGYTDIELEVPLIAPDPFLYGPENEVQLVPANAGVGLRMKDGIFDAGYISWGQRTPTPVATNDGNAPAYPTFTVRGHFDTGFTIRIGQRAIVYPDAVFPENPVTVMPGKVVVNKTDVTHRLQVREWEPIPAYDSVKVRFDGRDAYSEGYCSMTWRDTYI